MSRVNEKEQGVAPALTAFEKLHQSEVRAKSICDYLEKLRVEKTFCKTEFSAGVRLFASIANIAYKDRQVFFGDAYMGLHQNKDLADRWNHFNPSKRVNKLDLFPLAPPCWEQVCQDGVSALAYKGNNPAQALDKLLLGPTVIDCGMFCQLSIFFGLRYVLGDTKFNVVFRSLPFYVTQILFGGMSEGDAPHLENPLFDFFESVNNIPEGVVGVEHIKNHPDYLFKHLGGNYGGENCLVEGVSYTIFDPCRSSQTLSKHGVMQLLLLAFNKDQDEYSTALMKRFQTSPNDREPLLKNETHAFLFACAVSLERKQITLAEMTTKKENEQLKFIFNFDKFMSWALRTFNIDQVLNTDEGCFKQFNVARFIAVNFANNAQKVTEETKKVFYECNSLALQQY